MPQGTVIASGAALATSTTVSANQVQNTYDYIGAGQLKLYARGSAQTVQANLFVSGIQILRNFTIPFSGTAGALDTSAHLCCSVPTLGGRVELTFVATTGTPTVDFILTYEGVPVVGRAISKIFGR